MRHGNKGEVASPRGTGRLTLALQTAMNLQWETRSDRPSTSLQVLDAKTPGHHSGRRAHLAVSHFANKQIAGRAQE
jgi:hypothetical protein